MPRRKPFSGKAKKEYLKQKRMNKAQGRGTGAGDELHDKEHPLMDAGGTSLQVRTSLGKSGTENRWSTIVVRESDDLVRVRKERAVVPFKIAKKASVVTLPATALIDLPITRPVAGAIAEISKGSSSQAPTGSARIAKSDADALNSTAFQQWLGRIHRHFDPTQLNAFEHNI